MSSRRLKGSSKDAFQEMCLRFNIRHFEEDFLRVSTNQSRKNDSDPDSRSFLSSTTRATIGSTEGDDVGLPSGLESEDEAFEGYEFFGNGGNRTNVTEVLYRHPPPPQSIGNLSRIGTEPSLSFSEDLARDDSSVEEIPETFSDEQLWNELIRLKANNDKLREKIDRAINDSGSNSDGVVSEIKWGQFVEIDMLKDYINELFKKTNLEHEELRNKLKNCDPKGNPPYLEFAVRTICENGTLRKEKALALAGKTSELLTREERVRKQESSIADFQAELQYLMKTAGINSSDSTTFDLVNIKTILTDVRHHLELKNKLCAEHELELKTLKLKMAEKADWYIEKAQKLTLECAYLKQVLYEVGEKMELRLQSFIDAKNK